MEIKKLNKEWYNKADSIYERSVTDCMDAMIDMDEELKLVEECCQKAGLGSIYYQEKRGLIDEWKNILDRLIAAVYGIGYYIENDLDLTFSSRIAEIYDIAVLHDMGDYKTNKTVSLRDSVDMNQLSGTSQASGLTIKDFTGVIDQYGLKMSEIYRNNYNIYKKSHKDVSFNDYIAYNLAGKSEFDLGWSATKFCEGTWAWVKEIPESIGTLYELLKEAHSWENIKKRWEDLPHIFNFFMGKSGKREEEIRSEMQAFIEAIPQIPKMFIDKYTTMNREKGTEYTLGYILPDVILALIGTKGVNKGMEAVTLLDEGTDALKVVDTTVDTLNATDNLTDAARTTEEIAKVLKTIDTGNLKVIETKTPEIANAEWKVRGYDKPPYNPAYEVKVVQAGNEEYVRVFSYNADGTSNKLGRWLMKKSDIEGLTPAQIAEKYALPEPPTHICDVKINPETNLQTGIANEVEEWGPGGGQQFDTMETKLPQSAFVNERSIGD